MKTDAEMPAHGQHAADAATVERRQDVRISVAGRGINACLVPSLAPVTVLDMGAHGFSMQLREACHVGRVYDVRFSSASCPPVIVAARVVHVVRAQTPTGLEFVAGLEFIESGVQRTIDLLMHSIPELHK